MNSEEAIKKRIKNSEEAILKLESHRPPPPGARERGRVGENPGNEVAIKMFQFIHVLHVFLLSPLMGKGESRTQENT